MTPGTRPSRGPVITSCVTDTPTPVGSREAAHVLRHVDFAVIVWDGQQRITLANRAAASFLGFALSDLIGTRVAAHVQPAEAADHMIEDVLIGRYESLTYTRRVNVRLGGPVMVSAATRVVEVDGTRNGVTAFAPLSGTHRVGRKPLKLWLDLVPVVLGIASDDWTIQAISAEVPPLLGRSVADCVGSNLLDFVHPDDAEKLTSARAAGAAPVTFPRLRFTRPGGSEVGVRVLLNSCAQNPRRIHFGLIGRTANDVPHPFARVEELESRLRRIGAEVQAAGVSEPMGSFTYLDGYPQAGELTSRQWEILTRLVRGQRVSTIATELFISRSTVRNHLAVIFQKFGVHNQAELLELLSSAGPERVRRSAS